MQVFSFDLLVNAVVAGILLEGFYAAVSLGISMSFGLLEVAISLIPSSSSPAPMRPT